MPQQPQTSVCLGRMCTPVFHVIMSASVFNSCTFLQRKASLHSQQPVVQKKAAAEEEEEGPHLEDGAKIRREENGVRSKILFPFPSCH